MAHDGTRSFWLFSQFSRSDCGLCLASEPCWASEPKTTMLLAVELGSGTFILGSNTTFRRTPHVTQWGWPDLNPERPAWSWDLWPLSCGRESPQQLARN